MVCRTNDTGTQTRVFQMIFFIGQSTEAGLLRQDVVFFSIDGHMKKAAGSLNDVKDAN